MANFDDTSLALTERDRLVLFGPVLDRGRGLVGGCWAAEITATEPWPARDVEPLKGTRLLIDGHQYWGLGTLAAAEVITRYGRNSFCLALPIVPAGLGRWVHAPPPPLIEAMARRVDLPRPRGGKDDSSGPTLCVAMYVMGTSIAVPSEAEVGWNTHGKVVYTYPDQAAGETERAFLEQHHGLDYPLTVAPASGNNMFLVCLICVFDGAPSAQEKCLAVEAMKTALAHAPSSGSASGLVGSENMDITYTQTHLGPEIHVESGYATPDPFIPLAGTARWNGMPVTFPGCRFRRIRLDENNDIANITPYYGDTGHGRHVSERWRRAWFNHSSTPRTGLRQTDDAVDDELTAAAQLQNRMLSARMTAAAILMTYSDRDRRIHRRRAVRRNVPRGVVFLDQDDEGDLVAEGIAHRAAMYR